MRDDSTESRDALVHLSREADQAPGAQGKRSPSTQKDRQMVTDCLFLRSIVGDKGSCVCRPRTNWGGAAQ